ncbi:MAG: rod shape-determining protein RodA [Clostridia bacterium]|nr:rod shape-determining protein RodA [Clostridia bacterium]
MRVSDNHLSKKHFDWPLIIASYLLALYGVLAITIANYDPTLGSDRSVQQLIMDANNGRLQLLWVVLSIAVVAVIMSIKYEYIGRLWPLIYAVDILLLSFVLTTARINGVSGWFQFVDRTFQPSELAKVALIVTLSKALTRFPDKPIPTLSYFFTICIHFGIPAALIAAQPDIGTLMVFCVIFVALLFASGFELRWMFLLGGLALAVLLPIIFYLSSTNNFRWLRLVAFANPESDPTGSSYQIINSKLTIGSGGLYGKGAWAEGTLTHLNYVPENHTDFIFSVVGETLGFTGSLFLLFLYAFIILRMLMLAYYTKDKFGQLIIIGVMAMLLFHVYENVGMCIGVMPITGIPLPFISYGGTNLFVNMAGIGLVMNVTANKSSLDMHEKAAMQSS